MSSPETGSGNSVGGVRARWNQTLLGVKARLADVNWRKAGKRTAWIGGSVAGVLVAVILFLGFVDWNMLRGPVERLLSAKTGRVVNIDGDLDVRILSWTPSATVEGLRIQNPEWAGKTDMTRIEKLSVSVRLLPLFKGDVILPLLQIDRPSVALARTADGRNNWTFKGDPNKPASLPAIRRFEINDGRLKVTDDQRKLVFSGVVNSSEVQDGQTVQGFRLTGDGTLNNARFEMNVSGGPLLNVDPDKPYPFNAEVIAGATRVAAAGSIAKPFDLGVFDTTLAISGQDLADVYYLTGLTLPNTPPYKVQGRLARRGMQFTYDGMDGTFGSSDLHGRLGVDAGGERLMLTGDLRSNTLDFEDLAAIFGGGAATTAGDSASPEQAARARELAAEARLFPDTPLQVERLRTMDATVSYRADVIRAAQFPIRSGSVDLVLDKGLLSMNDLTFGLDNGQVAGRVAIDARNEMPAVDMDMRLSGARIDQFIPAAFEGAASGSLLGRLQLKSSGLSVRDTAANSNGQFTVVVPQGEMRENLAELLGVNVLRGLFTDPSEKTELRCAIADFKVTNGVATAQTLVVDTGPVIAMGGGTINLRTEAMDLRIKGQPKEPRLVRLSIPLQLRGQLAQPKLGVEAGSAVRQGALATLVATVVAPIAAILPFVDAGLADDANCKGLIAQAGTGTPAQVTTAQNAPDAG